MGEINRALGSAGAPTLLFCGEKTYKLAPLTKGVQGELEVWLYSRAVVAVQSTKEHLDTPEYAATLAALAERRAGGAYDFTGKLMSKALRTWEGGLQILLLLLRKHQPDMVEDDVLELLKNYGTECIAALNGMTRTLRGNVPEPEKTTTPATATASA